MFPLRLALATRLSWQHAGLYCNPTHCNGRITVGDSCDAQNTSQPDEVRILNAGLFLRQLSSAAFSQKGNFRKVYNDALHDYSTNEPTMDGTACLTYYLSAMQKDGMKQAGIPNDKNVYVDGGIIRTDPSKKQITLVFTAADKADGADAIISTLKKHGIKGGFFFTGEFYELYPDVVKRLLDEGHFVGSHSYGHLLYMPWEDRDSLLVTREEFENDMMKSYETLRKASIEYKDAPVYIPPYEYYNKEISAWAKNMGIQVINYTPGTMSNADYTTPDMGQKYRSSKFIYDKIMEVEKKEGLNGHLMLIHFGTDDRRTDKFYNGYLDKMIKTLKRKGYTFVPVREAVGI